MSKYAIWNRKDDIIVPTGQIFTPEQWMEQWPMFRLDRIVPICADDEINGAFAGTLGQMVKTAQDDGWDFSKCNTNEEKLACYEAWEASKKTPSTEVSNEELTATSLASIAASMEYQNMMTLEDTEEV